MIDLHTHSNISDGTDSPSDLVNKALAGGISVLALTDHDTTAGWSEAIATLRHQMQLVPGAEISCQTPDGISVHMLGLLFEPEYQPLKEVMAQTRENRFGRMERIILRLQEAGFAIELSDVLAELSEGATLGRPHLADALIKKGFVKTREEAFAELLHNKSKYYVAHYSPTPEVAIGLIKAAGGVAVIAHPLASLRGRVLHRQALEELVAAGLDGIEVDHRDHSAEDRQSLRDLAAQFQLVVTGSSDYHGNGKLNQLGENTTRPDQWEILESRADARRVVTV